MIKLVILRQQCQSMTFDIESQRRFAPLFHNKASIYAHETGQSLLFVVDRQNLTSTATVVIRHICLQCSIVHKHRKTSIGRSYNLHAAPISDFWGGFCIACQFAKMDMVDHLQPMQPDYAAGVRSLLHPVKPNHQLAGHNHSPKQCWLKFGISIGFL